MKDTGKTINGIKVYQDPGCPPGQLIILGNFIKRNPRRMGSLSDPKPTDSPIK